MARHVVSHVRAHLADRLGRDNVFADVVSIQPGEDFERAIEERVRSTNFLLAVIGSGWAEEMAARDAENGRDYVLWEIRSAIAAGVPVIPVLVDGASMPKRDELPPEIVELSRHHAVVVRPDPDFDTDMDRLLARLERGASRAQRVLAATLGAVLFAGAMAFAARGHWVVSEAIHPVLALAASVVLATFVWSFTACLGLTPRPTSTVLTIWSTRGLRGPAAFALAFLSFHAEWAPIRPMAASKIVVSVDVLVWRPEDSEHRGLGLRDPDALPLRAEDQIRIEVESSVPAYLYVFWIDTNGTVLPVYPWRPGHWEDRPEEEEPLTRLSLPELTHSGWPIKFGDPGMESVLVLARSTPLPRDVDLQAQLASSGPMRIQDPRGAVWFEDWSMITSRVDRGIDPSRVTRIRDPILEHNAWLKSQLERYSQNSAIVVFANDG